MLRFQPSSLTQFPKFGSQVLFILQAEYQKALLWTSLEEENGSIKLESTQQKDPTYSEGHPQAQRSTLNMSSLSKIIIRKIPSLT